MNDVELLKLAAKAAGIPYINPADGYDGRYGLEIGTNPMRTTSWNPLTDDGAALRLAVKLCMSLLIGDGGTISACCIDDDDASVKAVEKYMPNPYAATRRVIVRAAAEIGKAMK